MPPIRTSAICLLMFRFILTNFSFSLKFFAEGSRIEAAFRKYIHRASPKQKQDTYELFVCHGNVIRYFVCRALQFPVEGWLRMSLGNCSITWLVIRPNGNVSLRTLGDIGHLPQEKITFK
uniref:Serine/threonine-protein phosphatase PGAM5, mitochondrial n=1 Tax=Ascaris suum TaxID=6253 RepID=F1L1A3_ASCSU